ncbi:MAG: hypothetical protein ACPGGK_16115 [Pikeienuella sp.]
MAKQPFFVAYFPVPKALKPFLLICAAALIVAFGALAAVVGGTQDNPGEGAFRFDYGRQTVTGVLELKPYPILRITEGNEHLPAGHTLMMSAGGKRGLMGRAAGLEGRLTTVSGVILQRGDLDMLQVRGGAAGLSAVEGEAPILSPAEPLGRWRLAGEICDGKCEAGAMRPGRRAAHRACANLCIIGGVPPVFVSSQPIEGVDHMLIAGPDGGPMPEALLDHVAKFVRLEGDLERRGDLLVLKIDPDTVEIL